MLKERDTDTNMIYSRKDLAPKSRQIRLAQTDRIQVRFPLDVSRERTLAVTQPSRLIKRRRYRRLGFPAWFFYFLGCFLRSALY